MQLIHKYIVLGLEYFMPTEEHAGTVSQNPSHVYLVATSWAARPVLVLKAERRHAGSQALHP